MPDWSIGVLAVVAALAAAGLVGLAWRRRNGAMREVAAPSPRDGGPPPVAAEVLEDLGVRLGVPATLLQFSSAFCAPCRATRRICAEVEGMLDGVRHVDVDAEAHLDAVRALDVRRTPALLVIDAHGRVVRRASGQPTKSQVIAAVAPLLESAPR
ncbi:MAG: thioredoxin [Micromonosporaceae bacterium]|nr:thioredoxin [Micromonosporaceae bacterium]